MRKTVHTEIPSDDVDTAASLTLSTIGDATIAIPIPTGVDNHSELVVTFDFKAVLGRKVRL